MYAIIISKGDNKVWRNYSEDFFSDASNVGGAIIDMKNLLDDLYPEDWVMPAHIKAQTN
jgi:hypothetical protein